MQYCDTISFDRDRPLRVAQFIISRQLGGAERIATELVKHSKQNESSIESILIVQHSRGVSAFESVPVDFDLEHSGNWRSLDTIKSVRKLRRFCQEKQIDIVHSHWWLPDMIAALACANSQVRHVAHIHAMQDLYMPSTFRLRKWLLRRILLSCGTEVIACSNSVADDFQTNLKWPKKVTAIPNAVSVPKQAISGERPISVFRRIGIVGRLVKIKGHDLLLSAIANLKHEIPDIHLEVAGDGEELHNLRARCNELGISERVTFSGTISDMYPFFERNPLIVCPSIGSEGLPMAILEAMASGCIVVASDIGAIVDVIKTGENGYLFERGNRSSLEVIIASIIRMTKSELAEISRTARQTIESTYAMDGYVCQLLQIYSRNPVCSQE
jgi:glycosyltransferase involved in cell wall biosynthesis